MKVQKTKAYAMVYDRQGMPKVKNPLSVPDLVWNKLTQDEKDHINSKAPEHLKRLD